MAITAKMVSELRSRTGAGIMDCKKALSETEGDIDDAIKKLREQGLRASEVKGGRATEEGLIISYIHPGNRVGTLVELNCETDFVARTKQFQKLATEIAMQVAAAKPRYVSKDEVSEEELNSEKAILKTQALQEGKPDHIVDKIVEGRLSKFYSEACLLKQPYIRDADKTVEDLVKDAIAQLGREHRCETFCALCPRTIK